jgi:hypothetical protein
MQEEILKHAISPQMHAGETHGVLFRGRRAKRLRATCVAHPFWPHFCSTERQTPAFYFNMQPARRPRGAGGAHQIKRVRAVVASPMCDSPPTPHLRSAQCIFRPSSDWNHHQADYPRQLICIHGDSRLRASSCVICHCRTEGCQSQNIPKLSEAALQHPWSALGMVADVIYPWWCDGRGARDTRRLKTDNRWIWHADSTLLLFPMAISRHITSHTRHYYLPNLCQ